MTARSLLAALALLAVLLGCEGRPPLNRAQVIGAADSLLLRENLAWGEAVEVLPPDRPDADGRRWWQVRYGPGADGAPRLVLLDDESRWARLPPPDWSPRVPAASRSSDPSRVSLQAGPSVLLVSGMESFPEERRAALLVDVAELNRLADRSGLHPAFSLRQARDGGLQIVYGWQGDHGTARDERIRDWLALRTRWRDSVWLDVDG
jgi:hypothetical protein